MKVSYGKAEARRGEFETAAVPHLNEIYRRNPLLYDFALKRTLHHPETGARFPPTVFMAHPDIPLEVERASRGGR